MASDRQIAANRANAQKCTGPRTPEGKATSSQNALKTGIDAKSELIRFENRAEYEALIAEYYARFHPSVPEERCLVDTLIKSEWLGRRYMAIEANLWESQISDLFPHPLGRAFAMASEQFVRVDRRMNSAQRNFQQALKQLNQLQAKRAAEPEQPVAEPSAPDAADVADGTDAADVATAELTPESVSIRTCDSESQSALQPTAPEPLEFYQTTEEEPPIAA
jgi:hypothetical protein